MQNLHPKLENGIVQGWKDSREYALDYNLLLQRLCEAFKKANYQLSLNLSMCILNPSYF